MIITNLPLNLSFKQTKTNIFGGFINYSNQSLHLLTLLITTTTIFFINLNL